MEADNIEKDNHSVCSRQSKHRRWRLCTLLRCTCVCDCTSIPPEIPIYHSSICSLINFTWLTPFVLKTYKKGYVDSKDIWPYPSGDSCDTVLPRWENCVQAEIERQQIERLAEVSTVTGQQVAKTTPQTDVTSAKTNLVQSLSSLPVSSPDQQQQERQQQSAKRKRQQEPVLNLVWALLRFQLIPLFAVLLLRMMTLCVVVLSALFGLRPLIHEIEAHNFSLMWGIIALVVMVALLICKSVLWQQAFCLGGIVGVRLRGAVLLLCLHKLLKSKSVLSIRPTITNIFATDSKTFIDMATHCTTLASAFVMVIAVSVCGFLIIGPWSLMATLVFVFYIPIEFFVSSIIMRYRRRVQHLADQRLDILRELLSSIKLVKFLGLENFFYKRIHQIWRREIRLLRTAWILSSLSVSLAFTVPLLASVSTFLPHILLGNSLSAAQAFVFVGLWGAARQFVHVIPNSLKGINDARVASYRLSRVFYLPELQPLAPIIDNDEVVIDMKEVTAIYPKAPRGLRKPRRGAKKRRQGGGSSSRSSRKTVAVSEDQPEANGDGNENQNSTGDNNLLVPMTTNHNVPSRSETPCPSGKKATNERPNALNNLSLSIKKGQFIGVCGKIGSGKSTLLNAILGRLNVTSGSIEIAENTTTSSVMQDPWLFNGSVRENILFGSAFDDEKYNNVIMTCGLVLDLDLMEFGDATELTEHGANLSGGQRQRVCLARALYASTSLVLLDHPLSAIDIALSQQIFEEALMPLKGKATVIFVSHRMDLLAKCESIIVMDEGSIVESGTHSELLSNESGEYFSLVQSVYRQRRQIVDDNGTADNFEFQEEEEETINIGRLSSLVTKASPGLLFDEPGLDVSLALGTNRSSLLNHSLDPGDSINATVGNQMFFNEARSNLKGSMSAEGRPLLSKSQKRAKEATHDNGNANNATTAANIQVGFSSRNTQTGGESLFRSRVDVSGSNDPARRGHLALSTYTTYLKAAGHPALLFLVMVGYLITHGLVAFTKFWLAYWLKNLSQQNSPVFQVNGTNSTTYNGTLVASLDGNGTISPDREIPKFDFFLDDLITDTSIEFFATVYICCTAGVLVSAVIKSCLVAWYALRASNNIHNRLLSRLLQCPLLFFEKTKSGSIITRFSKDTNELTTRLPASLEFLLSNMSVLITANITIGIVIPWFFLGCVAMIVIGFFVFRVAQTALRDLRRYEAYSLQPVLSLLASVVAGAPIIAAFDRTQLFLTRSVALINRTSSVVLLLQFCGRWLSWRLDLLGNMLIGIAGICVLALRGELSPAFAGLALSLIIEMAGILQTATRMFLNTETSFVSVERLTTFEKRLSSELTNDSDINTTTTTSAGNNTLGKVINVDFKNGQKDGNEQALLSTSNCIELPTNWPSSGAITFESVCLSYVAGRERPAENGLAAKSPLALDDVSFEVRPREFVAIVGRSGSGKSSLASVLTRLYAINHGRILIDGVDIANAPLNLLRKSISVVPQDPFLFSGTIRTNLDPYNEHTDDELWAALERCAMKAKIQDKAIRFCQSTDSMAVGGDPLLSNNAIHSAWHYPMLTSSFAVGGKQNNARAALSIPLTSNDVFFSPGERQLICLARALIRDSPILILDEATASIDAETDRRIQETLAKEAHKRTILTIVHRIESILSPTSRCDRVIVMDHGKLVETCDVSTLLHRNITH